MFHRICLRTGLLAVLSVACLLAGLPHPSGGAAAQQSSQVAKLGPQSGSGDHTAGAARLGNGLVARFHHQDERATFWPGARKTAELVISNEGSGAIRDVLVRLQGEGLSIDSITSEGMRWRRTETGWLAGLADIAPGQSIPLRLGVTLNAEANGEPVSTRLLASLKVRGHGVGQAAHEGWTVSDCAGGFHASLKTIHGNFSARLDGSTGSAAKPRASLPGRWMFRPSAETTPRKLRTTQSAADRAVANRGTDPFLRRAGVEWLIGKLRKEMDRYMTQEPVQALCAPPDPMLDHLQDKIDRLKTQALAMKTYHRRASEIVAPVLAKAVKTIRASREASPHRLPDGVDLAALAGRPGTDQVAALLQALFVDAPILEQARSAAGTIEALAIAKQAIEAHPLFEPEVKWVRRRPGSKKYVRRTVKSAVDRDVTAALGVIERAAYLQMVDAQHDGVYGAVTDTLDDIRQASRRHCVCSY